MLAILKMNLPLALVLAVTLVLGTLFFADSVWAKGGSPLSAELSGPEEVPIVGDPDGSGMAEVVLNQGKGVVCFRITVTDIDTPLAAHIHEAIAGVAGAVVVNLDIPSQGLEGCVDGIDSALIKNIRQNPSDYYINVHNVGFPGGAIRGQLGLPDEDDQGEDEQ